MLAPVTSDSSNPSTAETWAKLITAAWRESFNQIIEVGRLLQKAKQSLQHGEFGRMCGNVLPFGPRTAQMLMAIAADPRLTNPKHVSHLPPHWGTLYHLTKLSDEQFAKGIERGVIRSDMQRSEVNGARSVMSARVEEIDSLDYFPTPPWATRAVIERVLPLLGPRGDLSKYIVREPACGEGHMAEVLREYAERVIASDIFEYGYGEILDFLNEKETEAPEADWYFCNPPFEEKAEQFILRSLARARVGVAMFLRLQWLESVGRYEGIFSNNTPAIIAQFAERVPLHKGLWDPDGDTATAYLWIVWLNGEPSGLVRRARSRGGGQVPISPFTWIPPGQREALTKDDDVERFTANPVRRRE